MQSVTPAPVEIVPTKGVSLRGNISIKLRDFTLPDNEISFFSKFLAQNPHYLGRRVEIFEGFIQQPSGAGIQVPFLQVNDGRREYIIDSMFLSNDVLTIKAKDPLTLADSLKSKVPEPSRFSLAEALGNSDTYSHINMKFDDVALDGSDSGDKSKVTDYFGADNATGFIRINEEILGYRVDVSGNEAALDITSREDWGTKKGTSSDSNDDYSIGDSIQKCISFGTYADSSSGSTIDTVAEQLLITEAGISSDAINTTSGETYSWADEKTNWLSTFKINGVLSEPEAVNKVLSELGSMVGVNFFWNDFAGKIIMRAETPELNIDSIITISDDEIIENSFKLINSEKERVSRVFYYYGQKNGVEDRDKPKNFKSLYVNIDGSGESAAEYGVESNKTIFAWGINSTSTATSITQRLLNRFKVTPITCTFQVDKSIDYLQVGDHFFLQTKHILTTTGAIKDQTEMQCLGITYNSVEGINTIKAKSFRFSTTSKGVITANIDSLNNGGTGYSANDVVTQTSTTGSAGTNLQVKILTVDGSGVAQTYEVVDYGENHVTGAVVTFGAGSVSGSGSGFKLNIVQGTFSNDGTGSGTDDDKYTGLRLTKSYISCDSSGTNARQFISATLEQGGSGYTNGTPRTFTQSSGEITIPSGLGTGLVVTANVVGGVVQSTITVTSNPTSGSLSSESSHKGFAESEILTLVQNGQSTAKIQITAGAKMSTGGEPYLIV